MSTCDACGQELPEPEPAPIQGPLTAGEAALKRFFDLQMLEIAIAERENMNNLLRAVGRRSEDGRYLTFRVSRGEA